MKKKTLVLCALVVTTLLAIFNTVALTSCTEINENFTEVNTNVTINDSTNIIVNPPDININIDITNNLIDSSKSYLVINQYGDSIYIPISVVNNLIATLNNNNTNNNTVTVTNPPTEECVDIPGAPIIESITQPINTSSKGSVILTGLPLQMWILHRIPDNVYTLGVGVSTTVNNLDPKWASNNAAKCYSTGYRWSVTNICWNTSPNSPEVMIATP